MSGPYRSHKIFGIGLQRTGTTSLHHAALLLGLRSAPDSIPLFYDSADVLLDQYDLFSDNPIPQLYQTLDKQCPDSKFILTTRPVDDWLRSVEWLFREALPNLSPELQAVGNEIHHAFYGRTTFDDAHFRQTYSAYHDGVRAYFENRPKDLLEIDFSRGDSWEPLCTFLDRPVPSQPFPHRNAAHRSLWQKIRARMRR